MYTDDVQICATLRNFQSDTEYLDFEDFWIEKLTEQDRNQFCKDLKYFTNYPGDNYVAVKWYYIGRGKSSSVLSDNSRIFFFPLFRVMKLFKTGDLITPLGFYSWNNKWYEMRFHGENYGLGYGLKGNPYFFKKEDIEAFKLFRKEMEKYLEYINFLDIPYRKKPRILNDIDMRCFFAIHILLKGSVENNNPFIIFDKLIDYTIGLESLYLLKNDRRKAKKLSSRIAALLSKDESEEDQLCNHIKHFYEIRNDIVHGSLVDKEGDDFLGVNIYNYEDILRKSVLAFLDLNLKYPTKEGVINILDQTISSPDFRQQIQESLNIFKLAR